MTNCSPRLENAAESREVRVLATDELRALFKGIQEAGYEVFGPKIKEQAVTLAALETFDDMPVGYRDTQCAGNYRLEKSNDGTLFGYAVGPHSVKSILHPAKRRLWQTKKTNDGHIEYEAEPERQRKVALFGIRSCDMEAISILDKVFLSSGFIDRHYQNTRKNLFVVTASCSDPSAVCFCTSMGHGPKSRWFDINITEVFKGGRHYFLCEAGSQAGHSILTTNSTRKATLEEIEELTAVYDRACSKIQKRLDTNNLPQFLSENLNNSAWDDVASRCLSCGNCTMVCPTCFCSDTYDTTDLTGDHSERWLEWDSCFTSDFSYIHGGNVRKSTRSRYRQWLTHKLGTWHEQFGTSGCVGCGRCVAWCPVGIDLTEEVQALKNKEGADQ